MEYGLHDMRGLYAADLSLLLGVVPVSGLETMRQLLRQRRGHPRDYVSHLLQNMKSNMEDGFMNIYNLACRV